MKRLIFLLTALCLIFPNLAKADEGWVIDNFASNITIQQDGKVAVSETIDADFGTLQKHGIFRDLPYLYTISGNSHYTDVQILYIKLNGTVTPYTSYKSGNFIEAKIGDPNKLISGKVEYEIDYLVSGVLRSFSDGDELYWDVTGESWPVPIKKASATVRLSSGNILQITCFEGVYGSKDKCTSKTIDSINASFQTAKPLLSNQGLTVVVGFPVGTFPILTPQPSPVNDTSSSSYGTAYLPSYFKYYLPNPYLVTVLTLLGFGGLYYLWTKKGRETKEAITVQYNPPGNLRPAELGTLMDESADTLDVAATMVDLAVRGYLTIEEKPKSWFLGKNDYILTKVEKELPILLDYEGLLIDRVFAKGNSVKISELKNTFYQDLVTIKSELYKEVVSKNFFYSSPDKTRKRYSGLAIFTLIATVSIFAYGLYNSTLVSSLALAGVINSLILIPLSQYMPKRTPLGHNLYMQGLGYKMFLDKVEVYQQKFLEDKDLFSKVMPYTIIFGITEKFAKTFDQLGIKMENPNWYVSSQPFNYVMFSYSINNFSFLMTSAISYHASTSNINSFSVSSSSGFSMGGGFSGGGFGGGGGGSW